MVLSSSGFTTKDRNDIAAVPRANSAGLRVGSVVASDQGDHPFQVVINSKCPSCRSEELPLLGNTL
jgi:hypothetical protein